MITINRFLDVTETEKRGPGAGDAGPKPGAVTWSPLSSLGRCGWDKESAKVSLTSAAVKKVGV